MVAILGVSAGLAWGATLLAQGGRVGGEPTHAMHHDLGMKSVGNPQNRPRRDGPVPNQERLVIEPMALRPPILLAAAGASEDLEPTGSLDPWLAAAADRPAGRRGVVVTSSRDGQLRCYDAETLRLLGRCRLENPAFQLAVDSVRGILHAACAPPHDVRLSPLGERRIRSGDLYTFDIRDLATGRLDPDHVLKPTWHMDLPARVLQVLRSAEDDGVYVLVSQQRGASVLRVSGERREIERSMLLRSATGVMALAAATAERSPTLYVSMPGFLLAIDTARWEVRQGFQMPGAGSGMVVAPDRRLFVADSLRACVLAIDPEEGKVLGHWRFPMTGWLSLTLSPDRKRLYVGNTTIAANRIWSVDLTAPLTQPPVCGEAVTDDNGLIRGLSLVTPDDRWLINSAGRVFRLAGPSRTREG
jgi:hypothetical protein